MSLFVFQLVLQLVLLLVLAAMLISTQMRLYMPLVPKSLLRLSAVADFLQDVLRMAAYLTAGPSGNARRGR